MSKVAIIGGGISGLCSAYFLAQKGFSVTVVDKTGFSNGCSYGNAGMIVPSHFIPMAAPGMIKKGIRWMFNPESPFYIRLRWDSELIRWGLRFYKASTTNKVERATPLLMNLNLRSKQLFTEMIHHASLNVALHHKGLIMYCLEDKTLHEEAHVAEQAVKLGMTAEVFDKKKLAELEPELVLNVAGGVYFPEDAFMTPSSFMQALSERAKSMGVKMINDTVKTLTCESNKIKSIVTEREEITADQFLITAGSWSSKLSREVKLTIPLQAGKGYSVMITDPPVMPRICNILTEARVAITPMDTGLRIAGTMELSGIDFSINAKRVQGIYKSVARYFQQFNSYDFAGLQVWAGLRPCSPDGLPFLGRSRRYPNLLVATGHGMMGFSLGPVTGKLISQIANEEDPEFDISLLNPERYN